MSAKMVPELQQSNTCMFRRCRAFLSVSKDGSRITAIKRVQNPWVWQNYCSFRTNVRDYVSVKLIEHVFCFRGFPKHNFPGCQQSARRLLMLCLAWRSLSCRLRSKSTAQNLTNPSISMRASAKSKGLGYGTAVPMMLSTRLCKQTSRYDG